MEVGTDIGRKIRKKIDKERGGVEVEKEEE